MLPKSKMLYNVMLICLKKKEKKKNALGFFSSIIKTKWYSVIQ